MIKAHHFGERLHLTETKTCGRDMSFEIARVPEFSHQLSETLDQQEHDIPRRTFDVLIIVFFQEVVPERRNVRQSLEIKRSDSD